MIGQRIGNFVIVGKLGTGGMGEVFVGEHERIRNKVAIKLLLPHVSEHVQHVERFFNEAVAVGSIQHAGIPKVFDVGFHDGTRRAFLIMELLAGETLGARIQRVGRLPVAAAAEIGRQAASVLEAVHKAGITHRDLKPENIYLVPDDELPSGERVKILDFGIAKLSEQRTGGLTATGGLMGTPEYMAPEQWKNVKNVDWRADLYSLGCLTFEMVTGQRVFTADSVGEWCTKHLTEEPPGAGSLVAIPAPLDALIARMLAKDPAQRPGSMREVISAFLALGAAGSAAAMPAAGSSIPNVRAAAPSTLREANGSVESARSRTKFPLAMAIGGVVVVAGAVAGVLAMTAGGEETSAPIAATVPPPPPADAMIVAVDAPVLAAAVPADAPTDAAALDGDAAKYKQAWFTGRTSGYSSTFGGIAVRLSTKAGVDTLDTWWEGPAKCVLDFDDRGQPAAMSCVCLGACTVTKDKIPFSCGASKRGLECKTARYAFDSKTDTTTLWRPFVDDAERSRYASEPTSPQVSTKRNATVAEAPPPPPKEPAKEAAKDTALQGGCDEISCVLDNYAGVCCAKFKKGGAGNIQKQPKVEGDLPERLDASMIKAGVAPVKARLMACGTRSSAKGIVKVKVKVASDGSVTDTSISQTPDPALGSCVAAAMKKARFARTELGGSFAYPVAF